MRWSKVSVPLIALAACFVARAQAPSYSNVGRAPTEAEIRAWNITVGPAGKELPPGSGTAKEGAGIFAAKCSRCHGPTAEGTQLAPRLVGGKETISTLQPVRTIGSYWPFATTVWDYINRAMPRNDEGSLSVNEVYSLTAFILYRNDIVREDEVIDAKTLPKIKMPNRDGFLPANLEDIADLRKRGCRLGHCP
jgi:S-disulfanyl-L-cysteine oxidoreductase SoxD